jgi:topoisomerase IA-like protein
LGEIDGNRILWRSGKYGYYIYWEGKDKSISWRDKDQTDAPNWEEVREYIDREETKGGNKIRELSKTIVAQTTRYGWALRRGTQWVKPPEGTTLETITLEQARAAFEMKKTFSKKTRKN